MARITISKDYKVLLNNVAISGQEIGQLEVAFSHKLEEKKQIFLIMKNDQGLIEIVEFVRVGADKDMPSYSLYSIPLDAALRISNEKIEAKILILDVNTSTYKITNSFTMVILSNEFELARQVFLVKDFGAKAQTYYTKLVELILKGENNNESTS